MILMNPKTTAADMGLEQAAEQALAKNGHRVLFFDWNGQRFVAKRIQAKARSGFKRLFLLALARLVFGRQVKLWGEGTGTLKPQSGLAEAERVQALRIVGVRVPKVICVLPEAVVYEHCGPTLVESILNLSEGKRLEMVMSAASDLANFHHAGCWHGGAQFRNVAVLPDGAGFCRIDFEEDFTGHFSLPLIQIYDLLLFLVDAFIACGDGNGKSNDAVFFAYQQQHWTAEHDWIFNRVAFLANTVMVLSPLIKRFGNPESQRTLLLARWVRLAASRMREGVIR
jgi:tRNA A-37 threonylcarbamoyl transferase component Bud32